MKILIVASQSKEDNNGSLKIANFFFGCRIISELLETAHVARKNWRLPHQMGFAKSEVVFNMKSGLALFQGI